MDDLSGTRGNYFGMNAEKYNRKQRQPKRSLRTHEFSRSKYLAKIGKNEKTENKQKTALV
jgi:hypothetical protein